MGFFFSFFVYMYFYFFRFSCSYKDIRNLFLAGYSGMKVSSFWFRS